MESEIMLTQEQNNQTLFAARQELARTDKQIAKKTRLLKEMSAEITAMEAKRAEQEQAVRKLETEEVVYKIRMMTANGEILPSDIQAVLDAAAQTRETVKKPRKKRTKEERSDEQAGTETQSER